MNFTGAILVGGRSTRMGADKAFLPWDGQPLWERQRATLVASGATEILLCGRAEQLFPATGPRVVADRVPGLGPLAGLAGALREAAHGLVLVLAVDLPEMRADFLRGRLLAAAGPEEGVVPERDGFFEPLAAVYPRRALALAEASATSGDRSLRTFCRKAVAAGWLRPIKVEDGERAFFRNCNRPEDLGRG